MLYQLAAGATDGQQTEQDHTAWQGKRTSAHAP